MRRNIVKIYFTGFLISALTLLFAGGVAPFDPALARTAACPAQAAASAEPALLKHNPASRTLKPYSISQTVKHYYDAPLGQGILEVSDNRKDHYYDWMFQLELPLWAGPDTARPLGWLKHGLLQGAARASAITGAGMVETGYEHTSFIVWDIREDWYKIKLAKGITAWTHRCHLGGSDIKLNYVSWPTFLRRHGDWLHFRKPVPHRLRSAPDAKSARVTTIGLNHKLVLLEIKDDWMKVDVSQPDITCGGGKDAQPLRHQGWVKWRDAAGPWVYFYTRGC